jgi:hypothetical protein
MPANLVWLKQRVEADGVGTEAAGDRRGAGVPVPDQG